MRRVSTFLFAFACLFSISLMSEAQTASVSITNPLSPTPPAGVPGYGGPFSMTAGEGFTGSRTPLTKFPINATSNFASPIFYYNTVQTRVYCKLTLSPDGNKDVPLNSCTISVKYGAGAGTVQSATASPGISVPHGASTTYYFTLSGISIPMSTNYQITVTMILGNATGNTNNLDLSSFVINGIEKANGALPVHFISFDGKSNGSAVNLSWLVANENNLKGYAVEKSNDGTKFNTIGFVPATNASSYNYVDTKTLQDKAYYRIKSVDVDESFLLSPVLALKGITSSIVIRAYPSPVLTNFSLEHPTASKGSRISVSSEDGRMIQSITPAAGTQRTVIDLSSAKAGLYLVKFEDGNGSTEILKLVKQ